MGEKREILAPGTETGPWTLDELNAGKGKSIFLVETEQAVYMANDLNTAMVLWANHSIHGNQARGPRDDSEVVNVGRIG